MNFAAFKFRLCNWKNTTGRNDSLTVPANLLSPHRLYAGATQSAWRQKLTKEKNLKIRMMYRRSLALPAFALAMTAPAVSAQAQTPFYKLYDIGTLDSDTTSQANGLNDDGYVVGSSGDPANIQTAFIYTPPNVIGGPLLTSLSSLADMGSGKRTANSQASAINNRRQIVGTSQSAHVNSPGPTTVAAVWPVGNSSVIIDVNTITAGTTGTTGIDIPRLSTANAIAPLPSTASTDILGVIGGKIFLYDNTFTLLNSDNVNAYLRYGSTISGTYNNLGLLNGGKDINNQPNFGNSSEVFGINLYGRAAGKSALVYTRNSMLFNDTSHGFLTSSSGSLLDLAPLTSATSFNMGGRIVLPYSAASAINDPGYIVGVSADSSAPFINRAAYWLSGGNANALPLTTNYRQSDAASINNAYQIVGKAYSPTTADSTPTVATFWFPVVTPPLSSSDWSPYDLNGLIPSGTGWVLTNGTGINNYKNSLYGEICGYGIVNPSGNTHAFLLISAARRTVSGIISLDGITDPATTNVSTGQFTFDFRPTDGSVGFTKTIPLGSGGSYTFSDIPAGAYTIHIKGTKWLAKNISIDASGGNVTNANASLQGGDATGDNTVDIGDFGVLVNAYGTTYDPNDLTNGYDIRADFNCDGVVDIGDFGILVNTYGTSGDM